MLNNLITIIAECQINLEQIKQLFIDPHMAFQMLSSNGHDIDQSDIKRFISLNDEEIKHLINQFNSNSDTRFTYPDFINSLKLNNNNHVKEALIKLLQQEAINFNKVQILKEDSNFNPTELFNQIDQFGKGYITNRTLKKCTNLSNDYISAFFRFLDKDNDGRIFENEFLSAFQSSQKQQLAVQYKDLRQSQEKEKQIIQQCLQIQQNLQINEEKNSQSRIKQVQQLLQSRLNLERSKGQNSYSSLLKVRQQLLQIDQIRRNSQRETFERLLKYQHQLIKNIKEKNEETTQKQKNLSSLHDQLYTMRTQQDLSLKRKREYSIHSQSQL
ncbi:unnamed protein product [Paramecium pentaurelia]|uniref:EF-hand domain-containing protein n=1 Tax=Paramecium pentaurelia TaxID=43138 RepID=A0A8S1VE87_9CILI|nr:unnamed protein product [Paramecium pentaurelia]